MVEKAGYRYVVELASWDGVGMHGSNGSQDSPGDQSWGRPHGQSALQFLSLHIQAASPIISARGEAIACQA